MESTAYNFHRDRMKTGDVIAFGGKGRVSNLIKWATRSDYSHVGMVVRADIGNGFGDSVFIIESSSMVLTPDVVHKQIMKGVQMHFLSKRLYGYNGNAWYLPLREEIEPSALEKMTAWLRKKHNVKTSYDYAQAIGAGIDIFDQLGLENEPDFSALFCSELVTLALQVAGVVHQDVNPSEITPVDVVRMACFDSQITLR